ncbi:hypothetical protein [Streptomyces sp. NBC_00557]|nr:hypothetical protein [Streptomyces sp. NBC_00557]WUC32860.1 hypothetical protein OG956_00800 [Streptomyces sp. NBC_00557]
MPLATGELLVVLAALASNTLGASLFTHQHPALPELFRLTCRSCSG